MSADLDRFDRMLDAAAASVSAIANGAVQDHGRQRPAPNSYAARRARAEACAPVTPKRPPRFVSRATCPMCAAVDVGVEDHGTLKDGTPVRQLAAHSPEKRSCQSGQPRCLGAGMRVAFVDGAWRGFVRVVDGGLLP